MAAPKKDDLLTTAKLAEKLGISQGKVKKLIEEQKIKPDAARGKCNFYGPAALDKIRKAMKKA